MNYKDFVCYHCLKFPVCINKKRIVCTDLFYLIINDASVEFDGVNNLANCNIRKKIKEVFTNIENVKPEKEYFNEGAM